MHHLLEMVAPEGVPQAFNLHELSFNAISGLPRSGWTPPTQTLMAGDRDFMAAEQAELEQAWAPTVRMGL